MESTPPRPHSLTIEQPRAADDGDETVCCGVFEKDEVELTVGSSFVLDLKEAAGSGRRVQLPHQEIFDAAVVGMDLLLDDGKIRLRVQNATENSIETKVITGGTLSNRKGVNVPGVTLGLSSLSEKDREDLEFALSLGFDWIALSLSLIHI